MFIASKTHPLRSPGFNFSTVFRKIVIHHHVAAVAEWYRYRTVACFVTGSSPVPQKTRRVGQRCTLNLSRAETSSLWCGVEKFKLEKQDGATCHTAPATIDLLKDTFGDRLISRFGPVNWPPRSCDLTPLDYFLWGYVKSLVYADKPQTLDHLEDNIHRVIADIRPQMLEKVIENWTSRLDYIRASRGSAMPEILFKM
ncbi:uncharacterized protein TNCV_5027421 [Trichonephila clavipes]|nr:uncharacterized protein TNCV_5027421 [Trichonephila clavipes]